MLVLYVLCMIFHASIAASDLLMNFEQTLVELKRFVQVSPKPLLERIKSYDRQIVEPKTIFEWFDAYAHVYGTYQSSTIDKKTYVAPVISLAMLTKSLNAITEYHKKLLAQDDVKFITGVLAERDGAGEEKSIAYARKAVIPADSTIFFWGDLHGDIQCLVFCLLRLHKQGIIDENFKILKPNIYFVFGGDYVDRGFYGCEVLALMAQLFLANNQLDQEQRVFCVRGNHDSLFLSMRFGLFTDERDLKIKGGHSRNVFNTFYQNSYYQFTGFLPSVVYVGVQFGKRVDYIQCCHGGFEVGWDPSGFLRPDTAHSTLRIQAMMREESIKRLTQKAYASTYRTKNANGEENSVFYFTAQEQENGLGIVKNKSEFEAYFAHKAASVGNDGIGFMWSELAVPFSDQETQLGKYSYHNGGRNGLRFGISLINALPGIYDVMSGDEATNGTKASYRIVALLRAHQHNDSMPQLWCEGSDQKKCRNDAQENNGLYVIYRQKGFMKESGADVEVQLQTAIPLVTTVATSGYTPSPSFIEVACAGEPKAWTLSNHFIQNFYANRTVLQQFTNFETVDALLNSLRDADKEGKCKWVSTPGKLYAWHSGDESTVGAAWPIEVIKDDDEELMPMPNDDE